MESLFTGVRGIGILRTSCKARSPKFAAKIATWHSKHECITLLHCQIVSEWFYCQHHKLDDPASDKSLLRCWTMYGRKEWRY